MALQGSTSGTFITRDKCTVKLKPKRKHAFRLTDVIELTQVFPKINLHLTRRLLQKLRQEVQAVVSLPPCIHRTRG